VLGPAEEIETRQDNIHQWLELEIALHSFQLLTEEHITIVIFSSLLSV
jgi:hypothetical protein